MSHNTYDNIVKNKGNIDYCIEVTAVHLPCPAAAHPGPFQACWRIAATCRWTVA